MSDVEVARVGFLGRWASLPTLEHYMQEATAIGVLARVPAAAQAGLRALQAAAVALAAPGLLPRPKRPAAKWRAHG